MPANVDAVPGKRVRTFKPKVSTGCITCKIRHVKCGEEKPQCFQCTRTGRTCDGYLPATGRKKRGDQQALTRSPSPVVIECPISTTIVGTSQELRAFDFFRQRTVPQLCGLFGSNFWNYIILQASHHEDAIKHAAIALGSLHEQFENGHLTVQDGCQSSFAVQQYTSAIRHLVEPSDGKKSHVDVALSTCVLFVCLETLRGHIGSAVLHIESGTKIILDVNSNALSSSSSSMISPTPYAPLDLLNLIFFRLEAQVCQIAGNRMPLLDKTLDHEEAKYGQSQPFSFTNLDEARNMLDYIWSAGVRATQTFLSLPYPAQESIQSEDVQRTTLSGRLDRWVRAFELYIRQNNTKLDESAQLAIHTLKIQRIMTQIYLTIDYRRAEFDEHLWDEYPREYEMIISHASFIVKIANKVSEDSTEPPKSTFTLESGINFPLFLVATKCRHSATRHKALDILMSARRQEGMMHSTLTARVARRIVNLEEESIGNILAYEEVPNWVRLSSVNVEFDREGKSAALQYERWRNDFHAEKAVIYETIYW
ncbi:hypothetical protein BJ875DRAFT_434393 [Amylocarpus encephaloides]|uniref:Zn(2)-C6 fungal-type domain-containing protein n=1 Tax=Amylocarpus encephaloides TaxID=45428 RepID=A0A9P8C1C5_9HELO|nr:hypothetical protein BJ875DRAFT_434393 [Amylocarpus encephaloides]